MDRGEGRKEVLSETGTCEHRGGGVQREGVAT